MHQYPNIQFIKHDDIDKSRYDECINRSLNARVYAMSWYLDYMCNKWHALVLNDYEMVMPLTWRKKWGFYYLYQPAFCQQLGIFSDKPITEQTTGDFLKKIPASFKFWDISLNAANPIKGYTHRLGKNYLLPLNKTYDDIKANYSRNAKRNIKKALDEGITIQELTSPIATISLHRQRFKDDVGATEKDYHQLEKLLEAATVHGNAYSVTALTSNGSVIASSTYLLYAGRIIFLINGNTAESFLNGATHLLKDFVIKKFAGSNYVMDFEGSDVPQFARFYEQFGAKEIEYYPVLLHNKLPWPLKYLKPGSLVQ